MKVCPSCHSLEGWDFCPRCGRVLEGGPDPLFVCTLGWSRSKEYEGLLSRFQAEPGYACRETAEEILHQVPLADLASTENLVRRYGRAMLWKETRFDTASGVSFDLHGPVGVCFLRHVLEGAAPCLRDEPCPFLGPMLPVEPGVAGGLQLAAHLISSPQALSCPYSWELVGRAAGFLPDPALAPFVAARAREALDEGRILMDDAGAFTARQADPACHYDVKTPEHIPAGATWAAMSGDLEVAVVDDQLRAFPDPEKMAHWLSASLVAPTTRGRHVAVPALQSTEPCFIVFERGRPPVRCGPFPMPFAVDPQVRHVVYVTAAGAGESAAVVLVGLVSEVSEPFWIRLHAWPAPESVRQLVTEGGAVAILDESGEVTRFSGGGPVERRTFSGAAQVCFAGPDVLAVLWQDGWKLTLWRADGTCDDFPMLLPVQALYPTSAGNLVLACAGRITEISSAGGILDFRVGNALWMSARGYMERTGDGFTWHVLDQTPVEDRFWDGQPSAMKVAGLPAEADLTRAQAGLMLEIVSYFLFSPLPRDEGGGWTRLRSAAPAKVRRELDATLRVYPWLALFDAPAARWPVTETVLDEFHHM